MVVIKRFRQKRGKEGNKACKGGRNVLRYSMFARANASSQTSFLPPSRVKKVRAARKKVLTNAKGCGNLSTVPRLERVPCKLNNEELEKAPEISDV